MDASGSPLGHTQLARLPSTSASPPASAAVAVTAGPKHVEEVAVAASASGAANQLERLDAVNRHPAYAGREKSHK